MPRAMKKNPERTAWIIISTAFAVFCTLCLLIPFSIYWYFVNATQFLSPQITSVRGTVLLGDPDAELSSSLTDGNTIPVEESFEIATDDTSQAILTFANDSSLTMYSNTRLILRRVRQPRFRLSPNPTQVVVELLTGRLRATSSRSRDDLNFNITTPHSTISLNQGSYSIEVNEAETQITNRLGEATVTDNSEAITLYQGQRAVVIPDNSILGPLPAEQNLLGQSGFRLAEDDWTVYEIQPIEGVTTTVNVTNFQGREVLRLRSEGKDNVHTETGVRYEVNKDVRDFQSLRVFAEVRLIEQSLPGGGTLGSEFPIMLHIAYKDADGTDRDWFHGFYYEPPPENYVLYNQPDNTSERIARYIWYPYESVNLLAVLGPTKPVFVKSIRIYSSGWIYESMVANISLLAQE